MIRPLPIEDAIPCYPRGAAIDALAVPLTGTIVFRARFGDTAAESVRWQRASPLPAPAMFTFAWRSAQAGTGAAVWTVETNVADPATVVSAGPGGTVSVPVGFEATLFVLTREAADPRDTLHGDALVYNVTISAARAVRDRTVT